MDKAEVITRFKEYIKGMELVRDSYLGQDKPAVIIDMFESAIRLMDNGPKVNDGKEWER